MRLLLMVAEEISGFLINLGDSEGKKLMET
jgi:hypothetical protein